MREARKPQLQKPEDTVNNDALLSIAEAAEKTSVLKKAVVEFVKPPIQESRQVFQVGESVQIPDSEHGFIGGTIVDTVQDGDKFLYVIGFERNERKLNKRISERQLVEFKNRRDTLFLRGARSVKKMIKGLSNRNPFTSKK